MDTVIKHLFLLLLIIIYSIILSLGFFIPLYNYFYIPIIIISSILFIIIITNLFLLYKRKNKYIISKNLLKRFEVIKNKIAKNTSVIFSLNIIYFNFTYLLLLALGFFIGQLLQINFGYIILLILTAIILSSISFNYLFIFLRNEKIIKTKNNNIFYINDSDGFDIKYLNKLKITIGIKLLPFLKEEDLDLQANINKYLLSKLTFKKFKLYSTLNYHLSKLTIDNGLITHFINILFFKISINSLNNNYKFLVKDFKKEFFKTKETYIIENNFTKNHLEFIYRLYSYKLAKELSFEFVPYINNKDCPKDYYIQEAEYIFDFMNNNKKFIKDLLYLNNAVISVREALAIKDEIIFEPSLTFINNKIFNTFNEIYYRKNIKNYSNNYLLNYDLYKRIIDDKNELKSPIELAFLAYSYLKVRDLNQAKLIFQRSLRINPKNNFAKHYLGVILIKENNPLGLNLLIESYETNPNYLESSLKLIDEYNIRNALNYTKNSTNLNSISLIKERLDFIESHELTTNSKVISSTLNEDIINLIKNDAQKFKYIKEIKTFTQVLDNYEKHYISILFTKESKTVDKTIVFYIFYYLLNNLDLPINTNNFFLYELKYPKKKYDVYSTYFNSKISTIIYQKEEL